MAAYCIFTNPDKCISCHACEVACRVKHDVPQGSTLGKLVTLGPELINEKPKMSSLYIPCFQCEDAWCIKACPADAIRRNEKYGTLYVLEDLCFGCQSCILACPWQIPQWNPKTGMIMKCDLCMDYIEEGKEPACVSECPTGALSFGEPVEVSNKTREEYGLRLLKKVI